MSKRALCLRTLLIVLQLHFVILQVSEEQERKYRNNNYTVAKLKSKFLSFSS